MKIISWGQKISYRIIQEAEVEILARSPIGTWLYVELLSIRVYAKQNHVLIAQVKSCDVITIGWFSFLWDCEPDRWRANTSAHKHKLSCMYFVYLMEFLDRKSYHIIFQFASGSNCGTNLKRKIKNFQCQERSYFMDNASLICRYTS